MAWRLAHSLTSLRDQVNDQWPLRDKSSDGTIGDTSHSARKSDHNPNAAGIVTAWDCDADLTPHESVRTLVTALQRSGDKRIKYIIFNAQITVKGDITKWKPYTGANAHKHHAHISVSSDPKLYDDGSPWHLTFDPPAPVLTPTSPRMLQIGDKGDDVRAVQNALATRGFLMKKNIDGDFGPNTRRAVIAFQTEKQLRPDGIVGEITRKALAI
jgi:hypothetical protein